MYEEVRSVLHSNLENVSGSVVSASLSAKDRALSASTAAAALATAGRSVHEAQIANHYNNGMKYGMAGSDGSLFSNYYRHTLNNHELLSIFCADKRNPFNRTRRLLVLFSKLSLSLCLAAAFSTLHRQDYDNVGIDTPFDIQFNDSFYISLILGPYGYMLKHIATCTLCTRKNCCVRVVSCMGFCTLLTIALLSVLFLITGLVLSNYFLNTTEFLEVFLYAALLDYLSYFYYGVWNWYFLSWEGCLVVPIFPTHGHKDLPATGFPPRFLPVLALWPVKKFLQLYGLCEPTYEEEKREFLEQFPLRISVDDTKEEDEQNQQWQVEEGTAPPYDFNEEGERRSNYAAPVVAVLCEEDDHFML